MKKKVYIPPKDQDEVRDSISDYKIIPETELSRKKGGNKQRRIFYKTPTPQDFPDNCVTLDTFFSDLEDYIRKNDRI
ncbi:MAG: hypothetical protein WCZ43_11805 [Proteiniphilum sp.]